MSGSRLKAGVIGVGHLGRIHARIYNELADVELVGVADSNADVQVYVVGAAGATGFALGGSVSVNWSQNVIESWIADATVTTASASITSSHLRIIALVLLRAGAVATRRVGRGTASDVHPAGCDPE